MSVMPCLSFSTCCSIVLMHYFTMGIGTYSLVITLIGIQLLEAVEAASF